MVKLIKNNLIPMVVASLAFATTSHHIHTAEASYNSVIGTINKDYEAQGNTDFLIPKDRESDATNWYLGNPRAQKEKKRRARCKANYEICWNDCNSNNKVAHHENKSLCLDTCITDLKNCHETITKNLLKQRDNPKTSQKHGATH